MPMSNEAMFYTFDNWFSSGKPAKRDWKEMRYYDTYAIAKKRAKIAGEANKFSAYCWNKVGKKVVTKAWDTQTMALRKGWKDVTADPQCPLYALLGTGKTQTERPISGYRNFAHWKEAGFPVS